MERPRNNIEEKMVAKQYWNFEVKYFLFGSHILIFLRFGVTPKRLHVLVASSSFKTSLAIAKSYTRFKLTTLNCQSEEFAVSTE